jgi:hypothetical protein
MFAGISLVGMVATSAAADADAVLTKEGKLKAPIVFRDGQSGFSGVTGTVWKIDTDGSWAVATFLNEKTTRTLREGKLTDRQLAALAAHLAALEVGDLPKELGDFKGANPHTFVLRIGDRTTTVTVGAGTVTAGAGQRLTEVELPGKEAGAWSRFVAATAMIQRWTAESGSPKEPR